MSEEDFLGWFQRNLEEHMRDGDDFSCMSCDMGQSGYSTKGPNHHDDIKPHRCFYFDVKEALRQATLKALEREEVKALREGFKGFGTGRGGWVDRTIEAFDTLIKSLKEEGQ